MTSSLVGSEMCIRDRICAWQHADAQTLCPHRLRRSMLGRTVGTGTPISVSYTHLTLPTICSV
eukprot:10244634-Prorocentrum_lima.AAC.1